MSLNALERPSEEDIEHLITEVERVIRSEIRESESEQSANVVLSRASEAVRDVINKYDYREDANALIGEVQLAVRSVAGIESLVADADSLTDKISRALHDAFGGWLYNAQAVGRNVRGRIVSRFRRGGDESKTRDNTVMCRVDSETLKQIDELIEAGLAASRSEAVAFLITAGIEARQDLFEAIRERIEAIRTAKAELTRIKEAL